jgi:hypothetical protein
MQGGKKYRTFSPSTTIQDTLCIYKDTTTFCKYLASSLDKVVSVNLFYSQNTIDVLNKDNAQTFLITMTKSSNKTVTTTFTKKKDYLLHLEHVALVRQNLDESHHPFIHVAKGSKTQSGKDIIGFSIDYVKGTSTYHTFQQVCDEYVDTMSLSTFQYNKMLSDVSSVIAKMHRKGYSVNGVSHHTIGYFKAENTFKILDWQFLTLLSKRKHNGYVLYSHPLKSYMNGATSLLAKRNIALGALLPKNRWVRQLTSYPIMKAYSKASMLYILETYKKKNYITLIPEFDNYSLALLSIFVAEKNKIKVPDDMISKWLSAFTPKAS